MIQFTVLINTIENVKNFNKKFWNMESDADLRQGRYVVDAKSVLGILSMDITRPIELIIYDEEGKNKEKYLELLKEYIVPEPETETEKEKNAETEEKTPQAGEE